MAQLNRPVSVRALVLLTAMSFAACDGIPSGRGRAIADQEAAQNLAVPEAEKIKIIELQIEELRAELAAEKQTREEMNKELAAAIDEVEAGVRATSATSLPSAPLPAEKPKR